MRSNNIKIGFSSIGGGGGSSPAPTPRTNIYVVEAGNVVAALPGVLGIKLITSVPATIPEYAVLDTYPTCVDGVGYVRSIDDGKLYLLLNAQPHTTTGLVRGQRILCYSSLDVQITGTPSLPDPLYRTQKFLLLGVSF